MKGLLLPGCLLLAIFLFSFTDPYLVKRFSDASYRYEFYTTSIKISPNKDKMYYWFKGGAVHNAQAGIAGELLHGKFTKTFHSNQLAEQGEFQHGLKVGVWKEWHPNGMVKATQNWKRGLKNGSYYEYSASGETVLKGNFRNDKRQGVWIDFVKADTLIYKKGVVYVKKPKLTKEEKEALNIVRKEAQDQKKNQRENEKKTRELKKADKLKEKQMPKAKAKKGNSASREKSKKDNFLKKLFSKKNSKGTINGQSS